MCFCILLMGKLHSFFCLASMCRCCPCVVFSVVSGLLPLGSVTLPMRLTICFTHTFVDWTRGQPKKSRKNQKQLWNTWGRATTQTPAGQFWRWPPPATESLPVWTSSKTNGSIICHISAKIGKCSSVLIEVFKSSPAENQTCVARSSGQQVQCGSTRCLQVARLGKDLRWLLFSESESCITAAAAVWPGWQQRNCAGNCETVQLWSCAGNCGAVELCKCGTVYIVQLCRKLCDCNC